MTRARFFSWCFGGGFGLLLGITVVGGVVGQGTEPPPEVAAPASVALPPPEGTFFVDSIRLGEPLQFAMWVRHPLNTMVLFPDSLHDFLPFEYISRAWFPTRSDSVYSLDSVVYTLATFEIDSLQTLRLPVWYLRDGDSTAVYTRRLSVDFKPTVPLPLPDSIALQATTDLAPVPTQFNYPYWTAGAVVLALLGTILFLLFGQPLRRRYQLYRLRGRQRAFERQFDQRVAAWRSDPTGAHAEALLALWKRHLHLLSPHPFPSYTTREITTVLPDADLNQTLRTLDRQIYGGVAPTAPDQLFRPLHEQATRLYTEKREEVLRA